jgi:hypothetical protein
MRGRLNAITESVLRSVEIDGPLLSDGSPNPAAELLASLLAAGNGLRTLALDRKLAALEIRRGA